MIERGALVVLDSGYTPRENGIVVQVRALVGERRARLGCGRVVVFTWQIACAMSRRGLMARLRRELLPPAVARLSRGHKPR